MFRQLNKTTTKNFMLSLRGTTVRSVSTGGYYKSNEKLDKIKKQDLPDERVNEIIKQAEKQKTHGLSSIETEGAANIHKAQKKIKKMVPKDVEQFD
ncbi:hypothetical protein DDB_G0283455 [Dictyostelium discoideum AX4]|uniref:Uncharacterized protein n=1 Tax=Dictyostelium discoideum TaxID=44689 RepID=Q54R07_DICDI|nr:hypothetical protein DDB_G0283455 [Dictyostelium discoideum AX4]EAL65712.1 hypothetical protein DDB_G0283455 [Dictyostelium discoideum AX4]|eukprot:XP_639084.1 hypothetical protein DDB_G0283455 [Dictyostelium discoideum AX4]